MYTDLISAFGTKSQKNSHKRDCRWNEVNRCCFGCMLGCIKTSEINKHLTIASSSSCPNTRDSFTAQNCVFVHVGCAGCALEFIEAIDYIFPAVQMWMGHVKGRKRRQDMLWFWLVAEASMKTCSCECVLGCPIKVDGWGDLYLALYDSCYLVQTCYADLLLSS